VDGFIQKSARKPPPLGGGGIAAFLFVFLDFLKENQETLLYNTPMKDIRSIKLKLD